MPAVDDPIARFRRYRREDGAQAVSLWELAHSEMELDARGVSMALGETAAASPMPTCVKSISVDPPKRLNGEAGDLKAVLTDAVREAVCAPDCCIALSGGVDSAFIVAMVRHLGLTMPRLVTLRTGFPQYDEVEAAQAVAETFDARCEVVDVQAHDYEAALPQVIDAVGQPLYNLHPVSRWLLASRADCRSLVTGDGADQVFSGAPSALYLPLVEAICSACNVTLASPFFATDAAFLPRDPGKRALRAWAGSLGVPETIAFAAKTPKLTPHDPATVKRTTLALFTERLRAA